MVQVVGRTVLSILVDFVEVCPSVLSPTGSRGGGGGGVARVGGCGVRHWESACVSVAAVVVVLSVSQ